MQLYHCLFSYFTVTKSKYYHNQPRMSCSKRPLSVDGSSVVKAKNSKKMKREECVCSDSTSLIVCNPESVRSAMSCDDIPGVTRDDCYAMSRNILEHINMEEEECICCGEVYLEYEMVFDPGYGLVCHDCKNYEAERERCMNPNSSRDLLIICKTYSSDSATDGFCHIGMETFFIIEKYLLSSNSFLLTGLDCENSILYRPILSNLGDCRGWRPDHEYCWPKNPSLEIWNLRVGLTYRFDKMDRDVKSLLPHKKDDLYVPFYFSPYESSFYAEDLGMNQNAIYEILKPLAVPSVVDIFGVDNLIDGSSGKEYIHGRCYIEEGTECPSVGILKINYQQLRFVEENRRTRYVKCTLYVLVNLHVIIIMIINIYFTS